MIYINKTKSRITFKIKNWYYLELLTSQTMKLLGSTKNKLTKDRNGENMPYLQINLWSNIFHCNIINNDYQQDSSDLYKFVPNKWFGQLLDISPKCFIFLKSFNSKFSHIEVCFTDQNFKRIEIKDKTNIVFKNKCTIQFNIFIFWSNIWKRRWIFIFS